MFDLNSHGVENILDWVENKRYKDIEYIGFVQGFVPNFSSIAVPVLRVYSNS